MILFCPEVDTHVYLFEPIARELQSDWCFLSHPDGGVFNSLTKFGLPYVWTADQVSPKVIVLGNDWGPVGKSFVAVANALGVASVVVQEGPLDFSSGLGQLTNARIVLGQGRVTTDYRNVYLVTGNPRYDSIVTTPPPERPRIMINCNFTYGIYEEARQLWISQAVAACQQKRLAFFISRHPREKTRLPEVVSSNAGVVAQQLQLASVLVTRYSSLIYEALLAGIPVIYHNPHGERMVPFEGGLPVPTTSTVEELVDALDGAELNPMVPEWLADHCEPGLAGPRVARALERLI